MATTKGKALPWKYNLVTLILWSASLLGALQSTDNDVSFKHSVAALSRLWSYEL